MNQCDGVQGVSFTELSAGFPVVSIKNRHAEASVAIQGAHLLSWQPAFTTPVLWCSENAIFEAGKAIRGGIPVCWPWFGDHVTSGTPAHGFARVSMWQLVSIDSISDSLTRLVFELNEREQHQEQWPHQAKLRYEITVGEKLELSLITKNTGSDAFELSQALHTYFEIGDINRISIRGLEGLQYLDKVENFQLKQQCGDVTIAGELDRIYLGSQSDVLIEDAVLQRRIRISKEGSQSTVVWNPWKERAESMSDMSDEGYQHMVCVEVANVAEDIIQLEPQGMHTLKAVYEVEKI